MSRNWGMGPEPDTLPMPAQEGEDDGGAFHDCNPTSRPMGWLDFVALAVVVCGIAALAVKSCAP